MSFYTFASPPTLSNGCQPYSCGTHNHHSENLQQWNQCKPMSMYMYGIAKTIACYIWLSKLYYTLVLVILAGLQYSLQMLHTDWRAWGQDYSVGTRFILELTNKCTCTIMYIYTRVRFNWHVHGCSDMQGIKLT